MKKLLYIGHSYHQKTKSSSFLLDELYRHFEVSELYFDPQITSGYAALEKYKGEAFDVVVIWQIMPSIVALKRYIAFKQGVFFPMADYYFGFVSYKQPIWREYQNFKIISFSQKMHRELLDHGFDTKYIQYFPKPAKIENWGDEHSVYFWQRITHLNGYRLLEVLKGFSISHLHLHKVLDPGEQYIPLPYSYRNFSITYSLWYNTNDEMKEDMAQYAIFFAPRLVEGIGMSFLEAMAMGRCVIANDDTTHNEYIEHGETGFLFDIHGQTNLDLSSCDIRKIQKNAYEYICTGYKKWKKELPTLVTEFLTPLKNNATLLKKNNHIWDHAVLIRPELQDPTSCIMADEKASNLWPAVGKIRALFDHIGTVIKLSDGNYRTVKRVSFLHIPFFEKKVRSDGRRVVILFFLFPVFMADIL